MADFFSRIFAIPSDSSSSDDDEGAADKSRNGSHTPQSSLVTAKKKGHSRTLTPLSTGEDGTTTLVSASQGPSIGNSGTAASDSTSNGGSNNGEKNREDQVKKDATASRRRYANQKLKSSQRSLSMSSSALEGNSGSAKNQKNRRSLSRLAKKSKPKEPLARANSWSSGDSSQEQLLPTKGPNDRHSSSPATSCQNKTSTGDSNTSNDNTQHRHHPSVAMKTKKKHWRSKLTGGMKKTNKLSPGTATTSLSHTPPTPSDGKKGTSSEKVALTSNSRHHQQNQRTNNKSNHQESTRLNFPQRKPPINVGDSIVISQQFLEESMEISVVTLPKELAMKEDGVMFDGGVKEQREAGQKKVLGNDLVRAFLDRQNQGRDQKQYLHPRQRGQIRGGYLDKLEEVGSGAEDNNNDDDNKNNTAADEMENGTPGIPSVGSGLYERISAYASRLLEEGSIYHNPSWSKDCNARSEEGGGGEGRQEEEGIEVPHSQHELRRVQQSKHFWPCDPTAEGYVPRVNAPNVNNTPHQQSSFPTFPHPPPKPAHTATPLQNQRSNESAQSDVNSKSLDHRKFTEAKSVNMDDSPGIDPSGILLASPTVLESQSFDHDNEQNHKLDPPGNAHPINVPGGNEKIIPEPKQREDVILPNIELNSKPARVQKAVTFCLPSSPHPPAPPFIGPPMDFYYSMERGNNDMPLWSSSHLMPPIIELWSPVENSLFGPGLFDGDSSWDDLKENGLVGEKLSLQVSGKWLDVSAAKVEATGSSSHHLDIVKEESFAPDNELIDDVLKYDADIDTRIDTNFGIKKLNINTTFDRKNFDSGSDKDANNKFQQTNSFLSKDLNSNDVVNRHRSSWRSAHNLSYKSPTLSNGSTSKISEQPQSLDGSISFDDPILRDRVKHEVNNNRPGTLHGRLLRAKRLNSYNYNGPSLSRSPTHSSSSLGSASSVAAMASAAIAVQSTVRGYLVRRYYSQLMECTCVIQRQIRKYLCRKRIRGKMKLELSYFPRLWSKRNSTTTISF
mmetsp:Transcript_14206/g.27115  ORF Transcript_14206/g.27115 Transcript_14206/m.27115 type:complete len:1012 (+) Transcript_14206:148-3183(+)